MTPGSQIEAAVHLGSTKEWLVELIAHQREASMAEVALHAGVMTSRAAVCIN